MKQKKSVLYLLMVVSAAFLFLMGYLFLQKKEVPITEDTTAQMKEEKQVSAPFAEREKSEINKLENVCEMYYYQHLSKEEQMVYDQVYQAILSRTQSDVSTNSEKVLDKVYNCVLNDHPEIFYTKSYTCTSHTRDNQIIKLTFEAGYIYDKDECENRANLIKKETECILLPVASMTEDFDKIKYIYDYLVNHTEYVLGAADNQNICSVFLTHQSVCQGYAKAMQYLLVKAGIEATFITGWVEQGTHAWNLVLADGEWYYLDPTWGDVDYQSASGMDGGIDKEVLPVNYDYFLITSDKLLGTHKPSDLIGLPNCAATRDNYYIHEGLYLTGLDVWVLDSIFKRAYEEQRISITFQCANRAVYDMVKNHLIDEQHIFDYIKANNAVSYYDNESAMTLCFWL